MVAVAAAPTGRRHLYLADASSSHYHLVVATVAAIVATFDIAVEQPSSASAVVSFGADAVTAAKLLSHLEVIAHVVLKTGSMVYFTAADVTEMFAVRFETKRIAVACFECPSSASTITATSDDDDFEDYVG